MRAARKLDSILSQKKTGEKGAGKLTLECQPTQNAERQKRKDEQAANQTFQLRLFDAVKNDPECTLLLGLIFLLPSRAIPLFLP